VKTELVCYLSTFVYLIVQLFWRFHDRRADVPERARRSLEVGSRSSCTDLIRIEKGLENPRDTRASPLLFAPVLITLIATSTASAQISLPPSGIINRVSGNGLQGYSGDGGPALNASFGWLTGITVDAAGDLFVLDGSRIREIASSTGVVKTVATLRERVRWHLMLPVIFLSHRRPSFGK
jgi:hypothetical protein